MTREWWQLLANELSQRLGMKLEVRDSYRSDYWYLEGCGVQVDASRGRLTLWLFRRSYRKPYGATPVPEDVNHAVNLLHLLYLRWSQ